MNMIVGKKQIILSALVLALSIAVYLNWQYAKVGKDLAVTQAVETTEAGEKTGADAEAANGEAGEYYGEAYFAEAKLTRTKSRDQAIETLKTMMADSNMTNEQKAQLALEAAAIARSIETEGKIENLIKAKGMVNCMVYYDADKVDVVVRTAEGLTTSEVAQIKDIILTQTDVPVEKITITEVK